MLPDGAPVRTIGTVPELPDLTVYVEALTSRLRSATCTLVRILHPFVLRSASPPVSSLVGGSVAGVGRLGKQIVIRFDGGLFAVIHLMIAGRLRWLEDAGSPSRKLGLAAIGFSTGTVVLTEAGTKKRASLRIVSGEEGLAELDRGGLELFAASFDEFANRLARENHTLKRALTDPRLFAGIGNAYSDEILHRSRLSPAALTSRITGEESRRLFGACRDVLREWTERLRREAGGSFPAGVTAFRPEMAVHGKYNQPCPVCRTPVQRIVFAENECNYCPECQTGGRLLADRALSRLLKGDWPATVGELEEFRRPH